LLARTRLGKALKREESSEPRPRDVARPATAKNTGLADRPQTEIAEHPDLVAGSDA
jgi:hypothetical protein